MMRSPVLSRGPSRVFHVEHPGQSSGAYDVRSFGGRSVTKLCRSSLPSRRVRLPWQRRGGQGPGRRPHPMFHGLPANKGARDWPPISPSFPERPWVEGARVQRLTTRPRPALEARRGPHVSTTEMGGTEPIGLKYDPTVQVSADRSAPLLPGAFGPCRARLREFVSVATDWPELRLAAMFHVEPSSRRIRAAGSRLSDLASAIAAGALSGAVPSAARSWPTSGGCRLVPCGARPPRRSARRVAARVSAGTRHAGSDELQGSSSP